MSVCVCVCAFVRAFWPVCMREYVCVCMYVCVCVCMCVQCWVLFRDKVVHLCEYRPLENCSYLQWLCDTPAVWFYSLFFVGFNLVARLCKQWVCPSRGLLRDGRGVMQRHVARSPAMLPGSIAAMSSAACFLFPTLGEANSLLKRRLWPHFLSTTKCYCYLLKWKCKAFNLLKCINLRIKLLPWLLVCSLRTDVGTEIENTQNNIHSQ